MRKRGVQRRRWLPRGRSATALLLSLLTCALMLSGCAAKQTPPSVLCPEPPPVPAQLKESSLPEVRSWSDDVRSFLIEAKAWLGELQ